MKTLPQCEWCGYLGSYCTHRVFGVLDGEHIDREVCHPCATHLVAHWPSLALLPMTAEDFRRHGLPVESGDEVTV